MERWLPVVGFEGLYEVSDLGRVRSLPRDLPARAGKIRRHKGKILTPGRSGEWGHVHVQLTAAKSKTVHLIVLEAFVGPRPDGMECRHLNGRGSDNRLENLRWGTKLENAADKIRHGTSGRGSRNAGAKLTDATVQAIRKRLAAGETGRALAAEYGVCEATVSLVKSGKNWSHVGVQSSGPP